MDVQHVIDMELKISCDPRVRQSLVFVSYFRTEMGRLMKLKPLHQSVKFNMPCGGLCEAARMSISTTGVLGYAKKWWTTPSGFRDELPLQGDLIFFVVVVVLFTYDSIMAHERESWYGAELQAELQDKIFFTFFWPRVATERFTDTSVRC